MLQAGLPSSVRAAERRLAAAVAASAGTADAVRRAGGPLQLFLALRPASLGEPFADAFAACVPSAAAASERALAKALSPGAEGAAPPAGGSAVVPAVMPAAVPAVMAAAAPVASSCGGPETLPPAETTAESPAEGGGQGEMGARTEEGRESQLDSACHPGAEEEVVLAEVGAAADRRRAAYKRWNRELRAAQKARHRAAAVRLQALQRGRSARCVRRRELAAATLIQGVHRGRRARRALRKRLVLARQHSESKAGDGDDDSDLSSDSSSAAGGDDDGDGLCGTMDSEESYEEHSPTLAGAPLSDSTFEYSADSGLACIPVPAAPGI